MTTIFNISKTKSRRQELRKQDIVCEKILWSKLKNKQQNYKFRRQYSVGNYIIDFYCPKLKLAIEIDGATHGTDEEIEYDITRTKYIESFGVMVKRYLNIDVKDNLLAVLNDINETCKELESQITQKRQVRYPTGLLRKPPPLVKGR